MGERQRERLAGVTQEGGIAQPVATTDAASVNGTAAAPKATTPRATTQPSLPPPSALDAAAKPVKLLQVKHKFPALAADVLDLAGDTNRVAGISKGGQPFGGWGAAAPC